MGELNSEELSIKQLALHIRFLALLLFKNRKFILVIALIFSITAFYIASTSEVKYKADLRFVVKAEGSSAGLVSGMLGGLGAVLGGGVVGSPLERTIEIVSSDKILGASLLSTNILNGKNEILANSLIRLDNLHESWAKDTSLRRVYFLTSDTSIWALSYSKRKAIKELEGKLIPRTGKGIISKTFDKKSGVVTISAVHSNEELAIILTTAIFEKLKDFYVEQITTSATNNVLILQKKVDSIKFELAKVQSSYARTTDQSFGLLFQEDKVELKKLAVREQMLMAMYGEAQKNLETFKFMNDSAIPTLTVIDMPYSPLKKIQKSKILYTAGGFFIGGFFTFLFIALRRWYKNLMAS
jgi:uncharacterized protein involved in exopolysaccharide biosynthesis